MKCSQCKEDKPRAAFWVPGQRSCSSRCLACREIKPKWQPPKRRQAAQREMKIGYGKLFSNDVVLIGLTPIYDRDHVGKVAALILQTDGYR